MKKSKKVIGWVGVDAGMVMVGDPCYLGDWKDNEYNEGEAGDYSYGGVCQTTDDEILQGGPIPYEAGHEGRAVVFRSGLGDGYYPVVGTYEEIPGWGRRITKAEIIFTREGKHPYEVGSWDDYFLSKDIEVSSLR